MRGAANHIISAVPARALALSNSCLLLTMQIELDDYVFAVLVLYLDIINLFVLILQLVGGRK